MSKIKIIDSHMRSFQEDLEEMYFRSYDKDGVLHEERVQSREVDYNLGLATRTSHDHGKTWSEWEIHYEDGKENRHAAVENSPDGDEFVGLIRPTLYDPKTGCTIGCGGKHYYLYGHDVGYFAWAEKGEDNWRPHPYYVVKYPDGRQVTRLLELEEGGVDFDPENPRNPAFIDKNRGYCCDPFMLSDGTIAFFVLPSVRICCNRAGLDVNVYFPSCPDAQQGIMMGKFHWNEEKQDYDITFSNPLVLSDLQSSRGVMEPLVAEIDNGRILLVLRGSNYRHEPWHTRIGASAPGYKWYTLSDDGGKTFAPLMPWHFDTREVVYSSASISHFIRSTKNGNLYWVGSYFDEPWRVYANDPRCPLHICQVDEKEGCLIKDTLTVVDDVRDGQTSVELSNFDLLENRETQLLELRLTKINFNGQYESDGFWYTEAWEYLIDFED